MYRVEGNRAWPSLMAAGPWDPSLQHGAAPCALIGWVAENTTTGSPMQVARMTIDLLRPVPIAPLDIRTEVLRQGRKIQLSCIRLLADDIEVVRASVLKVRIGQVELPETATEQPTELPPPEAGRDPRVSRIQAKGFLTGVSVRQVAGEPFGRGPAAAWFRADRPIIGHLPMSPLMRAAIASDFCNGVSAVLDPEHWTYINADTTLSLARMPVGEWILLDARTWPGNTGVGIAFARLADRCGYFGRATQTVLLERRS